VKINLKLIVLIFIIIIVITSSLVITYFLDDKNLDTELPIIETISGNITGKTGDKITIYVTFSDNNNVTDATLYYRNKSDTDWNSASIINGSYDILLNTKQDWYYYIVIYDAAGNGPVGNPSIDGSSNYTIFVVENKPKINDEYSRNVFVEEGAFDTCLYCPMVAKMLYELYTSGDYDFYLVTLVKKNEIASNRLDNEYNLFGLPTVFIDGGYKVIMGGSHEKPVYAQAIREAESRDIPKIMINVLAEYDNATNMLESTVFIKNMDDQSYDGRLSVYLTEKISRWSGPEGGPYHFGFLDYILQQEITIEIDENLTYSKIYDISELDPENLMVIAVIFNSEKKQGYSDPPKNTKPFDAYYADNADGTEVVEGGNLPPTAGFITPEIGKLHVLGRSIFDFLFHKKTVLIGRTTVIANASDDKKIEKVEFYINDVLVLTDSESPYEYKLTKVKSFKRFFNKFTIKVKAYDTNNKTGESSLDIIGLFL
jgi:hypothetical protein